MCYYPSNHPFNRPIYASLEAHSMDVILHLHHFSHRNLRPYERETLLKLEIRMKIESFCNFIVSVKFDQLTNRRFSGFFIHNF